MQFERSLKLFGCLLALSLCGLGRAPTRPPTLHDAPPEWFQTLDGASAQRVARVRSAFAPYQTGLSPRELDAVSRTIVEEADRHGINVDLLLAVIHTESGFSNFARSNVGALGLMQIMPATGEMLAEQLGLTWKGPETLFDPHTNVRMGTTYLAFLHARYDDWDLALAAYNWGPGAIDRKLRRGAGMPREYATKVMARLQSKSAR